MSREILFVEFVLLDHKFYDNDFLGICLINWSLRKQPWINAPWEILHLWIMFDEIRLWDSDDWFDDDHCVESSLIFLPERTCICLGDLWVIVLDSIVDRGQLIDGRSVGCRETILIIIINYCAFIVTVCCILMVNSEGTNKWVKIISNTINEYIFLVCEWI